MIRLGEGSTAVNLSCSALGTLWQRVKDKKEKRKNQTGPSSLCCGFKMEDETNRPDQRTINIYSLLSLSARPPSLGQYQYLVSVTLLHYHACVAVR